VSKKGSRRKYIAYELVRERKDEDENGWAPASEIRGSSRDMRPASEREEELVAFGIEGFRQRARLKFGKPGQTKKRLRAGRHRGMLRVTGRQALVVSP